MCKSNRAESVGLAVAEAANEPTFESTAWDWGDASHPVFVAALLDDMRRKIRRPGAARFHDDTARMFRPFRVY